MDAVVGLLAMLLLVCHGVETKCEFRRGDETQCYGALGGTVALKLMDPAPERFIIHHNNTPEFSWPIYAMRFSVMSTKHVFTPNDRTFRINNLERSDTGDYLLDIYNHSGVLLENRYLQLSIQAPVSSARLVTECLSQGEMRVSCSSEGGDSPQYSWTLNGQMLAEDKLLSGTNETDNITLRQDVSGLLACSVKNRVSHLKETRSISTFGFIFINCTVSNETRIAQWVYAANNTLCIEPRTTPTSVDPSVVCGIRTAVAALLFIGIAAFFAWRKKQSQRAEGPGVPRLREYPETSVEMVDKRRSAPERKSP